jgi:hypothetical protein
MASYRQIVRYELESALARRFPSVTPRDFSLLSRGVAYAFDEQYSYRIPNEYRKRLPAGVAEVWESELQDVLEKAVITGEGPGGIVMPSPNFKQPNQSFKVHLETLPRRDSLLPPGKREDFLHAIAFVDIEGPVNEALEFHGLSWGGICCHWGKRGSRHLCKTCRAAKSKFIYIGRSSRTPLSSPRTPT